MKKAQDKTFFREFHPIVYTLLFGTVFMNIFHSMCYPFFAIYLARQTNLDIKVIGLVIGLGAFSGIAGGFLGGFLSDLIGRRKVMFLSLFISVWVYLGYAVLNQPELIVVLILVGGFFGSLFDPVSKALMGDMTPAEKRMRAFSLRYIGVNIGYAVGPLLGSILGITGNPLPFLIMSMVYFIYLLLLFILLHWFGISEVERQSEALSIQKIFNVIRSDSALLFLVLGSVLSTIVHGRWSVPLSLYLAKMENGDKLFSLLLSVNSAAIIFLQPLLARKMERISPLFSIILGSVLLAAGELIFSITFIWWLFILAMIVFTIGEIMVIPSEYVLIDQITPEGMRGTYYGAQSFAGLGLVIGPWLSSLLLDLFGSRAMFMVMAVIALLSILFYWRGRRLSQLGVKPSSVTW